jgi:hypothetical protein
VSSAALSSRRTISRFVSGHMPEQAPLRLALTFLNTMNAVPEGFLRAGVQNYSWDKWTFFRLLGDMTGAGGGGRATVKRVDKTYHRALDWAVIGGLMGLVRAPTWQVAGLCAMIASSLKGG